MSGDPSPRGRLVLVVEDEVLLADVLHRYLQRDGFRTRLVGDGPAAVAAARAQRPDLVLLDVNLPGPDGFEVLREVRAMGDVPVIMVTARVEDLDRLVGFRLGADDYVTKPFNPEEVLARVHAVLRRATGGTVPAAAVHRFGDVEVDDDARTVSVRGERVDLTPSEYALVEYLARTPRRAVDRAELLDALSESTGGDRVVDAHVGSIRRKLRAVGGEAAAELIETVRGTGYRLWPPT